MADAQMIIDETNGRALLKALRAFKKGDFKARMPLDLTGIAGEIAGEFNEVVEMNENMTNEFIRVARDVGRDGKLGVRPALEGNPRGQWLSCTKSVSSLIEDLSRPIQELSEVVSAIDSGDLKKKMSLESDDKPLKGIFLKAAKNVNKMIKNLADFTAEVVRVAWEVGQDGKLGGQAKVTNVSGAWKELSDSVNKMATNLTDQVRNIAEVTTSVANGDLTKKVTVEARGEIQQLANTINTMVDQLSSFAFEVTRVSREVGTEGKMGGQAEVEGVSGTWLDLTTNVNNLARNLSEQVRNIAEVTTAVAKGDLTKKIEVDAQGEILELKNTINVMVDQLGVFAAEVTRVAREVGTEGILGGQAEVKGASGTWLDLTDTVNTLAGNLTNQVRNIAEVTTSVAKGDLTKKIEVDAQGEILELKNTINVMVDQLGEFAAEVTRVAREVGTEGKLGGKAEIEGVSGTWLDLTNNVNQMASNLTDQVRNIAEVTTAVAKGDLTKKIKVEAKGEILELRNIINSMVDQLDLFASEVTRVAREVGTEGKLGGKAEVKGVSGTWLDLTDNVNQMASNLTDQVRNIADVTTAVAKGNLTKKIEVDAQGEILELKSTINTMVDQLSIFAAEVTRVAREVGTEGKLGGKAEIKGVSGTWLDLTNNVNQMASNLTEQVRNIAEVTTAVAKGNLEKKIQVEAKGEILELRNIINSMVDQLDTFASEVTRVAREVGTEGKLGGKAEVAGVSGTWLDLTNNVNQMASNLTDQVRNISEVTTAVAKGDLTKKIKVDAQGEILELKDTINTMVDQLGVFAAEVTRVARDVGSEGKLGGQAEVKGVSGTWLDLTTNVNMLARNLTDQVRNISEVTAAVANGDLSKKITVEAKGEILQLRNVINSMVDQLTSFAREVTRVARQVGTEGILGGQAEVVGVSGVWKDLTDNVNLMSSNLTEQVRNIAEVTTSVANGDLTKKITIDAKGEVLKLSNTINTMVGQLTTFASEVTRVAREVGTDGSLGGQAQIPGVSGTWKDLTDNVNTMADNLTTQVRGIAGVITAVAKGDLKKKLTLTARGEIADLTDTINSMVETLSTFGDQVTNVAQEVGVEGRLGGQANVPDAEGIWKGLTNNVNELASNLTTQVRAIGKVASAVATGDLSQTIQVEVRGELADLRDNVNGMIVSLKETTKINEEQNWLSSNLAKVAGMIQGQRDLMTVAKSILTELAGLLSAQHGVFYILDERSGKPKVKLLASYAYKERKGLSNEFEIGEGLVGQSILESQRIVITDVPSDYVRINSGLGEATPYNIVVQPILFEGQVRAVIEMSSFNEFSPTQLSFIEQLSENIGIMLNTIGATARTEQLLQESQAMSEKLQTQQEELQQTNEELEGKAKELEVQNLDVEEKNRQIEVARQELEQKAEQLGITSKYKSEFLANMSHELRTPLNSLLILSKLMHENSDGNLTPKQVEYAETIFGSGSELLNLINEILDLSKIESGKMDVDIADVEFAGLEKWAERSFREVALGKKLEFAIPRDKNLPRAIFTDNKRLQQVLKNLLANAFKFTEKGKVTLDISVARDGWSRDHEVLNSADQVIAFAVKDTGIGIPEDQQNIIFEAFQQVDGTERRKYGGTGLGLSISREIARLLNGEIQLQSSPGKGSVFTLYLPQASEQKYKHKSLDYKSFDETPRVTPKAIPAPVKLPRPISKELSKAVDDDREIITPDDRVLLIIEDDINFAELLLDIARERGFKGIVADRGDTALALVQDYKVDAITLDIVLPDRDGWSILDTLKHQSSTRHIPIQIISIEEERQLGLKLGAFAHLQKPADKRSLGDALEKIKDFIDRPVKRLLVVDENESERKAIIDLIGNGDVKTTAVGTGKKALTLLKKEQFDCMVFHLTLPDMTGPEFIQKIEHDLGITDLPIIVFTGKELSKAEETKLKGITDAIIIKSAKSPERLLDETALFLHRVEKNLPKEKRLILEKFHQEDPILAGRKVLIVDDDVRNIFAITAFLERYAMKVVHAENGKDGLDLLRTTKDIDIVLMDIMMPGMDGYEVMKEIRKDKKFKSLPIIAITAKAMKGDREKCIEAGASDYVSKPVDMQQLLSLLRVWVYNS
jgi:HAMP domain-containing protein/signal transduction histidine kinase/DNA-binding response OmpR family regulator